jgi:transcriptional regulator with XRE-family HTH domain
MARPSDPLLKLIRDLTRRKGLNSAALAKQAGIDRARLKKVLAGQEPMTVDELIMLSESLELDAQALAQLGGQASEAPPTEPPEEDTHIEPDEDEMASPDGHADPYGNQAEQLMRYAFGLECDIFCHLESALLQDSGVPSSVLSRFPEHLPLRLEAAYHHHHQPRFLEEGLQLLISFDALYTCTLPWACFQQITLFPVRWEPPESDVSDAETSAPLPQTGAPGAPHLRLVD